MSSLAIAYLAVSGAVHILWDVVQEDDIAELTGDDSLAELMEEPPGGENHGWTKTEEGSWRSLQYIEEHPKHRQVFVDTPRIHGFAYGYVRLECRCVECRAWKAVYDADRLETPME